jgi:hypothetical protein
VTVDLGEKKIMVAQQQFDGTKSNLKKEKIMEIHFVLSCDAVTLAYLGSISNTNIK